MYNLDEKLEEAREISWHNFGKNLTVFLPGMFSYNGLKGKYQAISITGSRCDLQCDHCRGTTLGSMIPAESPELFVEKALLLADKGHFGILISGGCDRDGRLPWEDFCHAISEVKKKSDLFVSIHCGILDDDIAISLKNAGVDQALVDVIGSDQTYQRICHVDFGISSIVNTMESLERAGIPIIPHVICGMHYGKISSEEKALDIISRFNIRQVVIVSLMALPGTPLQGISLPDAEEIAEIILYARFHLPDVEISLGCARQRGDSRLEMLAIDAGITRMALPSEEALARAKSYGLDIRYQRTCCSVPDYFCKDEW